MARDPLTEARTRTDAPRRALDLDTFDRAVEDNRDRTDALAAESSQRLSAISTSSRRSAMPALPAAPIAYNDQTGEWAIQARDGTVRIVDKAPATLFALAEMPDLLEISELPPGFRGVQQEQLRAQLDSVAADSDFLGEMGAAFKSTVGLAASAIDALIGNDDPSNSWSNAGKDYSRNQTVGQYKASQASWYTPDGFMSGLGETVGNIGGNVVMAAPAAIAGTMAGGPAGTIFAGAAGVTGAASAGGEQATEFYDTALDEMAGMSEQELFDTSAPYRDARVEGMSHEDAMRQTAIEGARVAMGPAAGLGAIEGVVGGVLGGRILARLGLAKAATGGAARTAGEEVQRSLGRRVAGGLGAMTGAGIASGAQEVAETSLSQAAGAAHTGIGSTNPLDYASFKEFEDATQAGFLLRALGGRSRGARHDGQASADNLVAGTEGAIADMGEAFSANAGNLSPNADEGPAFLRRGVSGAGAGGPRGEGEFGTRGGQGALNLDIPAGFDLDRAPPSPAPNLPAAEPEAAQEQQGLFDQPPQQVVDPAVQEQQAAQSEIARMFNIQTPEQLQQAVPQMLDLADQNPGFAAMLEASGLVPYLLEQSPESQQAAAGDAANQFNTMRPDGEGALPLQPQRPAQGGDPRIAGRVRGPESAQRAAVSMPVPEPIDAPTERTADGRPLGVAPAPTPSPEPMHPEQARQATETARSRRRKAGLPAGPAVTGGPAAGAPVSPEAVTPSTPEPAGDIAAQVEAMADPESGRTAVFIADGNEASIPPTLPPDAITVSRKGRGTLITFDAKDAAKFSRGKWTDADNQRVLGYSENKTGDNVGGVVVEARTPEGAVAAQQLAKDTPKNKVAAAAAVRKQARQDAVVVETTPEKAQAERTARASESAAEVAQENLPKNPVARKAAEAKAERKKKVPVARVLEQRGLDVATDAENAGEGTRTSRKPAASRTERVAETAAVTEETPQPARREITDDTKRTGRTVKLDRKPLNLPATLMVETGVKGDVVDLRVQAVDAQQKANLIAAQFGRKDGTSAMSAIDAREVEVRLRDMKQLEAQLDAAVAAAEDDFISMVEKSPEGLDFLVVTETQNVQAWVTKRRRQRVANGGSPRGRPGAPTVSVLVSTPLLVGEALQLGRRIRRQAAAEVKSAKAPEESASRRLIPLLFPELTDAVNNPDTLADAVRAVANATDAQIDNAAKRAMVGSPGRPSIADSLLAKQVMRGMTEVAHAAAAENVEKRKLEARAPAEPATEAKAPAEETPGEVTLEPATVEGLGLTEKKGPRITSFGDLPAAVAQTLEGWAAMLEKGGVKSTSEVVVLSMENAQQLFPEQFPTYRVARYAKVVLNGKPAHVIAIDWDGVGNDAYAVEMLAHEFGEYVVREVYNRSDRQTQQAVRTAYEAWLAANGHLSPTEMFRSHAPALLRTYADVTSMEYAGKYSEWMANHVARYLTTRAEPRSIVEKFFARVADFLRQMWRSVAGDANPDVAVAQMLDDWIAGRVANTASPDLMERSVAGDLDLAEGSIPERGRKVAQAVVNRSTAGIAAAKEIFAETLAGATSFNKKPLVGDAAAALHGRMMQKGFAGVLRRVGLSMMTLRQIAQMFSGKGKFGQALKQWTNLQFNKQTLANVALNGGTLDIDGKRVSFTGAADVLDRVNSLSTRAQDALADLMRYATRYGVHPEQPWEHKSNEHLWKDQDDRVVLANRRRYEQVRNMWVAAGKIDTNIISDDGIYVQMRDSFKELHDKTIKLLEENIDSSDLTPHAKKQAKDKISAYRRTLKDGPYFPLVREGDWIVTAVLPSTVTYHETASAAEATARLERSLNKGARVVVEKPDEKGGEYTVRTYVRGVYFFNSAAEARAATESIMADVREELAHAGTTVEDMEAAYNEKLTEGEKPWTVISEPREKSAFYKQDEAITGGAFLSELRKAAKAEGVGIPAELAQVMEDIYVESLPEFSIRKTGLRRQNVLGASRNMISGYAMRYQGAARQYATVAYSGQINSAWQAMQSESGSFDGAQAVLDNLTAMQQAVLKRTASTKFNTIQNIVTDVSSLFSLAFSPAYVMMNAMQVSMITAPVLAGFSTKTGSVGAAKAASYIKAAYADTSAIKFFTKRGISDFVAETKRLMGQKVEGSALQAANLSIVAMGKTPEEKLMLERMLDSGLLDFSFLNSVEDAMKGGWGERKFGNVARLGMAIPQQVEAMNRVVSALAAFRVAKNELGQEYADAVETATSVVGSTQLDYSRMNRPLAFNQPFLSVILQFKLYMQGMYALFVRNAAMMTRGATPEERRQGFKTLMYMLGTHGAIGGATGLGPLAFTAKAAVALAAMAFGLDDDDDDDEWKSSDQLFRERAAQIFGESGSQLLERGLPAFLGFDVADRLAFPTLLDERYANIRETDTPGQQLDKWTLFAIGGAPYANLRRVIDQGGKAGGAAAEGDTNTAFRELVKGLPAGPRAMMRSLLTAREGIIDTDGDTFVPPDQLGWTDIAVTAMGFQPAHVARGYRERSEEKRTIAAIRADRESLFRRWRTADPGDKATINALREEITTFNTQAPGAFQIKAKQLAQSRAAKAQREGGEADRQTKAVREYLK